MKQERDESLGFDNSESLMPERDDLWAKHDGLTPKCCAEMIVLAGRLEVERNMARRERDILQTNRQLRVGEAMYRGGYVAMVERERDELREKYRIHHEEAERLTETIRRYHEALRKIAYIDYRGNRSAESSIAYKALNP